MSQGSGSEEDTARCRKVSTASVPEVELESLPPEAVTAQSQLLDTALSCLSLLLALSPPLSGLLKGKTCLNCYNGYYIRWIIHQIFMFLNKVVLAVG